MKSVVFLDFIIACNNTTAPGKWLFKKQDRAVTYEIAC
jgi:hypothetical protein